MTMGGGGELGICSGIPSFDKPQNIAPCKHVHFYCNIGGWGGWAHVVRFGIDVVGYGCEARNLFFA